MSTLSIATIFRLPILFHLINLGKTKQLCQSLLVSDKSKNKLLYDNKIGLIVHQSQPSYRELKKDTDGG